MTDFARSAGNLTGLLTEQIAAFNLSRALRFNRQSARPGLRGQAFDAESSRNQAEREQQQR